MIHKNTSRSVRLIAILALILFAATAVAVSADATETIDHALMLFFRDGSDMDNPWGPAWFEETAGDITALGGYPIIILVTILGATILLLLRRRVAALFLVAALGSGSLVSTLLKQVFSRPRPDLVDHMDRVFTSSFPSAHAMVSTVFWLTLGAIAVRFVKGHNLRLFIIVSAAGIAGLVGISRVYLGVHWPTDVFAGWCMGMFWAALCWLVARYFERHTEPQTDLGHSRV